MNKPPAWVTPAPPSDLARPSTCRRCARPVLVGAVEGVLAVVVDPVLLSPLGEVAELLRGGTTLRLWGAGRGRHLAFRGAAQIRLHPGQGLPRHHCDRQHGPPDPALLPTRRTRTTPDECPF